MNLGLIVRCDNRGLGIQTWEYYRHLQPAKTLVVDMAGRDRPPRYEQHPERFPDGTVIRFPLDQRAVLGWADGLDVVLTAETFYDAALPALLRAAGTIPVAHVNPEFWPNQGDATTWAPTSWRLGHLPAGTPVVPVPVAAERFTPVEPHDGLCRFLHVVGKRVIGDRNGTDALLDALPLLTEPCTVTIAVQDGSTINLPQLPEHVTVDIVGGAADYWDLYTNHDAIVMPRRFGGLCLPVQEAMAAGMAVVMTDIQPNARTWPIVPIPTCGTTSLNLPCGPVDAANPVISGIAEAMDLQSFPGTRHQRQDEAREWAAEHTWGDWAPIYRRMLSEVE